MQVSELIPPFDVLRWAKDSLAEPPIIEGSLMQTVEHNFFSLPLHLLQLAQNLSQSCDFIHGCVHAWGKNLRKWMECRYHRHNRKHFLGMYTHHATLSFNITLVQIGVQEDVRKNLHGFGDVILENLGIVDSVFARGIRIEVAAHVFYLLFELLAAAIRSALHKTESRTIIIKHPYGEFEG